MKKLIEQTSNLTLQDFRTLATSSAHSSTLPSLPSPWFITGFVAGEGCFSVTLVSELQISRGYI